MRPLSVKTLLVLALAAALAAVTIAHNRALGYDRAWNSHNLLRLHVVAHSDDAGDQEQKLEVRDAVLRELAPELEQAQNAVDARRRVAERLEHVLEVARNLPSIRAKGYEVTAGLGVYTFPQRSYGSLHLPAGEYYALRLQIGAGEGGNWWCVLFPPLCYVDLATPATAPEPGEEPVLHYDGREGVPVQIRFALLEFIRHRRLWAQRLWELARGLPQFHPPQ